MTVAAPKARAPKRPSLPPHDHDADYAALLQAVGANFGSRHGPLFCTDASEMWAAFHVNLPAEHAVHACRTCRHFVERFGGLVQIDGDGSARSVLWGTDGNAPIRAIPAFYAGSVAMMQKRIRAAKVTGPFLSPVAVLGQPVTGMWHHLSAVDVPVFRHSVLTPEQVMAAKREDYGTVQRALAEFSLVGLNAAINVLEADAVSRAERFTAPVRWLIDLKTRTAATKDHRAKANIVWLAVATAPDGFCHPRAGMIGSLLEDIAAGLPFADVKRKWEAKMHPLRFQRPVAAPTAGNIAAAEKLVEQMGLAPALERRFARLADMEAVWRPAPPKPPGKLGGVFGHLQPGAAGAPLVALPPQTMTWVKFRDTVMPKAEAIECFLAPGALPFTTFVTAMHENAPQLLKWDNPVSWYCWAHGSPAAQYRLPTGWRPMVAIVPLPTMWGPNPQPHLGEGVVLALDGAHETQRHGLHIFPETLRAELHAVRATIEAHSKAGVLRGDENEPTVTGLDVRKGQRTFGYRLRVTSAGHQAEYTIDRWD